MHGCGDIVVPSSHIVTQDCRGLYCCFSLIFRIVLLPKYLCNSVNENKTLCPCKGRICSWVAVINCIRFCRCTQWSGHWLYFLLLQCSTSFFQLLKISVVKTCFWCQPLREHITEKNQSRRGRNKFFTSSFFNSSHYKPPICYKQHVIVHFVDSRKM